MAPGFPTTAGTPVNPNHHGAGRPEVRRASMGRGVGGGRPGVALYPDAPPPPRDPMQALHTHVGRAGARVHAGVPGERGEPGATNVPVAGRAGVRGAVHDGF